MDSFYSIEDIEIIEIEASEEIEKKNLKSFISTFLELKYINLSKDSKVILNYINELGIYQLLILNSNFKHLELELFSKIYEENNQKNIIAFLYRNYFLIFKNSKFYYLQKIEENIKIAELMSYLNKNFEIDLQTLITIDKESLYLKKDEFLQSKNKNSIEFLSLNKNYSFLSYIFYLLILTIFILFFYTNENIEIKSDVQNFDTSNILENYKFNSFEDKARKIIYKLNQKNLNLIGFEFDTNILKLEINSKNKEDIYKFLEDNEIVFSSSNIDFIENKNIFKASLDVKIFE